MSHEIPDKLPHDIQIEIVFNSNFPHQAVPALPEFLSDNSIEGMLPGEIIHPYGSGPIYADSRTGYLYTRGSTNYDAGDIAPTYYGENRTGLMRIAKFSSNGQEFDGFIADMRLMKAGVIYSKHLTYGEDENETDQRYAAQLMQDDKFKPLLAVVFTDPDGNNFYSGEASLQDDMRYLMQSVDELRNPDPNN